MALSIFRLPDLGEGLTEADVVEWYVAEGESVALDQPVVALESAKAVVDIPSPVAGRVRRHCARPGETVATGAPLVEFEIDAGTQSRVSGDSRDGTPSRASTAPGASHAGAPDALGASAAGSGARTTPGSGDDRASIENVNARLFSAHSDGNAAPQARVDPAPDANAVVPRTADRSPGTRSPSAPNRINAMPAARSKARALGVDLSSVTGTGPAGASASPTWSVRRGRRRAAPGRRRCAESARRWPNAWPCPARGSFR